MANRLTDVIKSVWNGRTTTPIADLVALLQTIAWNFASGLNVTGTVAVTGNETVSGTLGVTGTTTAGVINASGKLTVSAGGAAVTGGLVTDNIKLGAGTVLSSYVEGTFTPTVVGGTTAGTATYSIQTGTYTRIGNRCFFQLQVAWTVATGTGNFSIAGLPFTVNAAGSSAAALTNIGSTLTGAAQAYLPLSDNHVFVIIPPSLQAMVASGNLIISGHYQI